MSLSEMILLIRLKTSFLPNECMMLSVQSGTWMPYPHKEHFQLANFYISKGTLTNFGTLLNGICGQIYVECNIGLYIAVTILLYIFKF